VAITNFIPKIWSDVLLVELRNRLVYGQPGTINRNYEGDIAQAGDTVNVTHFVRPAVRSYTRNTDITWDLLTDDQRSLVVNQQDYFAFTVDDVDRRQALPGFVGEVSGGAAFELAKKVDSYLSGVMQTSINAAAGTVVGVDDNANRNIGAKTVAVNPTTAQEDAWSLLLDLRTQLTKAAVPDDGRFLIVPPDFLKYLLKLDQFIFAAYSGDQSNQALRNGFIGRAAGFDIFESNTVPFASGAYTIIAGHPMAVTFAEQIVKTEAIRLQNQFGDGIRGLHVYGSKVIVPNALAGSAVTLV
jgi:hypothetical protein